MAENWRSLGNKPNSQVDGAWSLPVKEPTPWEALTGMLSVSWTCSYLALGCRGKSRAQIPPMSPHVTHTHTHTHTLLFSCLFYPLPSTSSPEDSSGLLDVAAKEGCWAGTVEICQPRAQWTVDVPWWFWQRERFRGQEIQRGGRRQGPVWRWTQSSARRGEQQRERVSSGPSSQPNSRRRDLPPGGQSLLVLPYLLDGSRKVWGQRLSTTCSVPWLLWKMVQELEGLRRDAHMHAPAAGSVGPARSQGHSPRGNQSLRWKQGHQI